MKITLILVVVLLISLSLGISLRYFVNSPSIHQQSSSTSAMSNDEEIVQVP